MNKLVFRHPQNKDQKRALSVLIILAILMLLICIFAPQKTDLSSENISKKNSVKEYTCLFPYRTGFFPIDESGVVTLLWEEQELVITDKENTIKQYAAVYPVTLKDKTVKYEISDTDIAEISDDGTITAKKAGTVIIKATLVSSGYSCESTLTIKRGIDSIFMPTTNIVMNKSDSFRQLDIQIFPENATDKTIVWRSKDPLVASVDLNGTLKPIGKGMTEIVAETLDGKHSAKCFVQVVDEVIKPQTIEILNKQSAYLDEGQTMTMVATIAPYNTKDKSVSWTSSDDKIATVSQSGRIKAISNGTCQIVAKTSNGKSDMVELVVNKGTGNNPLDLNDRPTSSNQLPLEILGDSYVNNITTIANGQITYVSYPTTLVRAIDIQLSLSTPRLVWTDTNTHTIAKRSDIAEYINPHNYYTSSYKYQFLNLGRTNGISATELNEYLRGKGVLEGQGQAFIDAANAYNISEIYLVAHACLETGYGTSTLARGVNVNGTTVYNIFGIAAYDTSALVGGSQMAYKMGWTSPRMAIMGGAKWISENYVNNSYGQNTLYDMLWNPANPGVHQYATDISWAIKQTATIARFADRFPSASLSFEIPIYEGETAIYLN